MGCAEIEVVAVVSSTRNLRVNENHWLSSLSRVKKSGVCYALYLWFITQGYLLCSLGRAQGINQLAKKHAIPLLNTPDINQPQVSNSLKKINADAMLCVHFNQRVHPHIYDLFNGNAFNLHPSLLPELKGVDPAFYAVLEDYNESGITLHHLAEHFDEGETVSQALHSIESNDSVFSLNKQLFTIGAKVFKDYIRIGRKHINSTGAMHEERYDSWPTPKQVRQLRKKKRQLIKLEEIYDLLRE
ncbi:formyltransferase family protein [Leucothrix mucor]|uniref:formyltransferase family protein n=1 Tax=Leucothrix mucor TaxID=45248 RepID=UPI0003B65B3B|nr:formyltransferase family protein [Leucothrix mucor]